MKTNHSVTSWLALAALLFLNLQSSTTLAQGGNVRTNSGVLTQEQNEKFNEAFRPYRNDLSPLFTKLATAQAEAVDAVLAEKPDADTLREKLDAVGKIQTEIGLLRFQALKEILPSLTDDQKSRIRARVGMAYNQLLSGPAVTVFAAGSGGGIIRSNQFSTNQPGTNQFSTNQVGNSQIRSNQIPTNGDSVVNLEWVGEGFRAKFNYNLANKVDLSPTQPARVTRMPENVSNPLFGTISFGRRWTPVDITILLDEPENGVARLWIDSNGNGDLTDDPPIEWVARTLHGKNGQTTSWSGSAGIPVNYGTVKRTLGIKMYRSETNDPQRQRTKNTLSYYPDFGFRGNITLGGKTFAVALVDDSARGDFLGDDVMLFIDLNNNGMFEYPSESFDVHKPFNIGGTTYEITGLTAQGGSFKLVKSSKTVVETPVPPTMEIGTKPVAFQETNTTGQLVRFPSDYKGKLVMLDFWAAWHGPSRAELPNLAKVYEEFHPKGFEVIGVSLDTEQTMPKLAGFIADNHMPWPQICDGNRWRAKLALLYGVNNLPACWLIDGDTGLVVAGASELQGAALRPTIERCLANLGKPTVNGVKDNMGQ
jgi:peroxiredoxin